MTKVNNPPLIKEDALKSVAGHLEDFAGTLENLSKIRMKRIEAQARLISSCRTEEEINRYKAEGLLDFEGPSL